MFTLFWVYVGPSWDYVGTRLGFVELSWAYAGFCWVVFGPSWDYVASPGLLRAYVHFILGLCWTILGLSWGHLGTMLGFVGSSWAYVGPSWDYVGRSWVLCWAILAMLRRLGTM